MADNQFPDHNDSLENECYDNYFTQSKEYSFHDEFTYHLLNAMLQPAYTKLLMIERITGTDGFASLESFKINRAGNSLVLIHLIL